MARTGETSAALVSMSYDPVDALADFAREHGIDFPMLSDVDSRVIRELGLEKVPGSSLRPVDPSAPPDRNRGLPHPGTFFLDADGIITDKHFEVSHRIRPSGSVLLSDELDGVIGDVVEHRELDGVRVTVQMLRAVYRPQQLQRLTVTLIIPEGRHVYVGEVPPEFTALTVRLSGPQGLVPVDLELPRGRPHRIEGTHEELNVISGRSNVDVVFRIDEFTGDVSMNVDVSLQSCSSTVCYAPSGARFKVLLAGEGTLNLH